MEKIETNNPILALRPGRREMGVAVLEGAELAFWGIAGFRAYGRGQLLTAVETRLQDLVQTYQPIVLAIEQPTRSRLLASPMLAAVIDQIGTAAVDMDLQLLTYCPGTVRKRLCGSRWVTRQVLAGRIVELYPHLARYQDSSSLWQETYWMPMFAAVAVALVCAQDLSSSPPAPRGAGCAPTDILTHRETGYSSP